MFKIQSQVLTLNILKEISEQKKKLALSPKAIANINKSHTFLQKLLAKNDTAYYGINTGFGSLCDVKINADDLSSLQENLIMSHACGVGEEVPHEIVKWMLLLKIQNLSYGHSGVQLMTVQRLVDMYNLDILPVVYNAGSLGASGDLAPLAHLSLPLIGKGEVYYKNQRISSAELFKKLKWKPIQLSAKEGLALLNGTQFMSAYGIYLLLQGEKIFNAALYTACASIDGFDAKLEPFDARIHTIRNHAGQQLVAASVLDILSDSKITGMNKVQVQDPYTFRCIPQVLGASYTAMQHVHSIFMNEINAVTDNPNIFVDDADILSGGNFHGQALALALDYLKLALHEIGNMSERRTYQLIAGLRGLPAFLNASPGLHSGMMIPQYAAASLVSRNKQLCTPASADSIPSSNGQEDHVSMGANAAVQALQILNNLWDIISIEWLCATQALHFRKPLKSSSRIESLLQSYRRKVSFVQKDRVLRDDIIATKSWLQNQFS